MLRIERPIEPLSKITRGVVIRHLAADDTSRLGSPSARTTHARIHARAMCKPTEARDQLSKPLLRYRCIAKKSATLRAGRELSSAKRELEILHGWTVDVADVAENGAGVLRCRVVSYSTPWTPPGASAQAADGWVSAKLFAYDGQSAHPNPDRAEVEEEVEEKKPAKEKKGFAAVFDAPTGVGVLTKLRTSLSRRIIGRIECSPRSTAEELASKRSHTEFESKIWFPRRRRPARATRSSSRARARRRSACSSPISPRRASRPCSRRRPRSSARTCWSSWRRAPRRS